MFKEKKHVGRPSNEELEILQPLCDERGTPNVVTDIFKARSGEWTQVRIWSKVNLGTMKKRDLFITASRLEAIDGFFEDDLYEMQNWDDEQFQAIGAYLNYLNERT